MNIPVIIVHIGNQEYLNICIKNNEYFNNDVYLIGDETNKNICKNHINYKDIKSKTLDKFNKLYKHISPNNILFEKICIQRWFYIAEFMKEKKINKAFICDSDVLLYCNINNLVNKYYKDDLYFVSMNDKIPVNACQSIWTLDKLNKFINFIVEFYEKNDWIYIQNYWNKYNDKLTGGISDMYLLYCYITNTKFKDNYFNLNTKLIPSKNDLTNNVNNRFFDNSINKNMNCFKNNKWEMKEYKFNIANMENIIKKIIWINRLPYCYNYNNKKNLKCNSIHFHGSKNLMLSYSVFINNKLNNIIQNNRNILKTIPKFITDYDYKNSIFNYGLPIYALPKINLPLNTETTYVDFIMYLSTFLKNKKIKYVEIGVSVLKTFYQFCNYLQKSILYAFDIEKINPTIERKFKLLNIKDNIKEYIYNNNIINYFNGDVFNKENINKFKNIVNKADIIFSDAHHSYKGVKNEYEYLIKNILNNEFILYYDDLDNPELLKFFKELCIKLYNNNNNKLTFGLLKINGWLGQHEHAHLNGVITTLNLPEILTNQFNIEYLKFNKKPTISAIFFSLNDNYTKDNKERLIIALNYMLNCVDEVVYVDWGSPNNVSLLELPYIKNNIPKTNKLIHVKISRQTINDIIPKGKHFIQQSIIRNIAIRKTTCDYIISTNVDIIFPNKKDLYNIINNDDKQTFYSISRKDVPMSSVIKLYSEDKKKLREHLSSYVKVRGIDNNPENKFKIESKKQISETTDLYKQYVKYARIWNCGDFQMAHRNIWYDVKGFEEKMLDAAQCTDTNIQKKICNYGYKLKILNNPDVFHMSHPARSSHSTKKFNDLNRFLINFDKTENSNEWGVFLV